MPAHCLIRAVNPVGTSIKKNVRGAIIEILNEQQYGYGNQVLPHFAEIVITDRTAEQVHDYRAHWPQKLSYSIQAHNPTLDGYRIRLEMDPSVVSAITKLNTLKREKIERYINRWNGAVYEPQTGNGIVTFDAGIYNALASSTFWDVRPNQITYFSFTEDSAYYIANDEHSVTVDYTILFSVERANPIFNQPPWTLLTPAQIDAWLLNRIKRKLRGRIEEVIGLDAITNVDDANKRFTFVAGRDVVRQAFVDNIKEIVDSKWFTKRKYYFNSVAVDTAIANGGIFEMTAAEAINNYIRNRLDE